MFYNNLDFLSILLLFYDVILSLFFPFIFLSIFYLKKKLNTVNIKLFSLPPESISFKKMLIDVLKVIVNNPF